MISEINNETGNYWNIEASDSHLALNGNYQVVMCEKLIIDMNGMADWKKHSSGTWHNAGHSFWVEHLRFEKAENYCHSC